MYKTYRLDSAQDINTDILEAIKVAFKSKPITITIEEEVDLSKDESLPEINIKSNSKAIIVSRLY